jgi:hypothetical protein
MVTVNIDETTEVGKRILRELSENPDTAQVKIAKSPRDENGNPIGKPWEEVLEDLYNDLSEHYGVDLRTL